MIQLSFSTINNCLQPHNSHNWLNKVMGLKPEERPVWKLGKEAHKRIQAHVSGKMIDPRLRHIKCHFPIVEEKDFDERCKFKIYLTDEFTVAKNNYKFIGFYDGLNHDNKQFLEIKSSDPLWSVGKFQKSIQRKLYAWANPELKEAILITCSKNPDLWESQPPKVYKVPLTEQDREDATQWISEGIKVLEGGKFDGGLEDEACQDRWCYFGNACSFKI